MSLAVILIVAASMLATSFLSGIFGMAGGLILIGILLAVLPVPEAMALHGVTQTASNGWRALLWWRYIRFGSAVGYLLGCVVALVIWAFVQYVPDKSVATLLLGVTPLAAQHLPTALKPDARSLTHGLGYGAVCMSLLILTGVVGPLVDLFFLGGTLDRREVVATKAFCQVFGHAAKFLYFGALIEQTASVDVTIAGVGIAASIVGTSLARRFLEALTDAQYRTWAGRIILAVSVFYIGQGSYLLVSPQLAGLSWPQ